MKSFRICTAILIVLGNFVIAQDSLSILQITSSPSGSKIYLDGEISGSTPYVINRITTGKHRLKLSRDGYEDWVTTVHVELIDTNTVHAILNPLRGQIQVNCDVKNAYIYLDDKLVGRTPKLIRDIEYGTHYIEIRRRKYYPRNTNYIAYRDTVRINDHKVNIINATLETSWISINSKPEASTVMIDGKDYGHSPLKKEKVRWGTRDIELNKEGYESKNLDVLVKPGEHKQIEVSLEPISYNKVLFRSVIYPGIGQIYADQKVKGYLYSMIEFCTISTAIIFDNKMSNETRGYDDLYKEYLASTIESEIIELHKKVQNKYDEVQDLKMVRNIMIGSAIAVWLVNIYDAHRIGKKMEQLSKTLSKILNNSSINVGVNSKKCSVGINYLF
jgi:hypothetical protein